MKLDLSVAPEIARLAEIQEAAPADDAALPAWPPRAGPVTVGYLVGCLRLLVADPQVWWGLVRFDPCQPVRVPVPMPLARCEAWLLVAPPGDRGDGPPHDPGWQVACVIAGELAEQVSTPGGRVARPLLPGRLRVRGGSEPGGSQPGGSQPGASQPGGMVNTGSGYAISLHARALPGRRDDQPSPDSRRVTLSRPGSRPMPGSPA